MRGRILVDQAGEGDVVPGCALSFDGFDNPCG